MAESALSRMLLVATLAGAAALNLGHATTTTRAAARLAHTRPVCCADEPPPAAAANVTPADAAGKPITAMPDNTGRTYAEIPLSGDAYVQQKSSSDIAPRTGEPVVIYTAFGTVLGEERPIWPKIAAGVALVALLAGGVIGEQLEANDMVGKPILGMPQVELRN